MNESMQQKITIAIIAFLLGMGAYWLAFDKEEVLAPSELEDETKEVVEGDERDKEPEGVMSPEESMPPVREEEEKESYSLEIGEQAPGSVVRGVRFTIPETVWVGVHDERNGKPGAVLGAKRFRKGLYEDESIQLFLAPMESGNTYYAIVRMDDGDDIFDYTKDKALLDQSGNFLVVTTFTVR